MSDFYKTKDIGEAAALLTVGHRIREIQRTGKLVFFVFDNTPEVKSDSQEYFFGNLTAQARDFYANLKMLKHRIFND